MTAARPAPAGHTAPSRPDVPLLADESPAWIGLGSNLPGEQGDPRAMLALAREAIAALPGTRTLACSALYRSPPFEAEGPDFFNQVLQVQTRLPAPALLQALLDIETSAGRQRPYRNAPRTLDLDLLLYGTQTVDSAFLTLPHPRMSQRLFVLMPLAEIDPQLQVPGQGTASALLARLRITDPEQRCERLSSPDARRYPAEQSQRGDERVHDTR